MVYKDDLELVVRRGYLREFNSRYDFRASSPRVKTALNSEVFHAVAEPVAVRACTSGLLETDMSDVIAAVVVEALLVGGRLALFAAGFTILFGGVRMPFVAYGQIILLGAYGIWTANAVLQQNYFVAATVAFVALFPLLLLSERLFRPLYLHPYPVIVYLILTIGLTEILSNTIELVYTVDPRTLFTPYLYERTSVFGLRMTTAQLISIVVTYLSLLSIGILVSFTRFGRALRAMVQDRETAMLMGVDIIRLSRNAYLLAMSLGIIGGMIFTLVSSV